MCVWSSPSFFYPLPPLALILSHLCCPFSSSLSPPSRSGLPSPSLFVAPPLFLHLSLRFLPSSPHLVPCHPSFSLSLLRLSFLFPGSIPCCSLVPEWPGGCCYHSFKFARNLRPIQNLGGNLAVPGDDADETASCVSVYLDANNRQLQDRLATWKSLSHGNLRVAASRLAWANFKGGTTLRSNTQNRHDGVSARYLIERKLKPLH